TLPPSALSRLAVHLGAAATTTATTADGGHPARRRVVGFVALSALDHLVQAGVDALKPQLARERSRAAAIDALAASLRAAFEAFSAADPVLVATLARFVAAALRTAEAPAALLAPAHIGAAWAAVHVTAIAYGLALPSAADAWFAALGQTVAGVLRPRHAQALSQRLAEAVAALNLEDPAAEAAVLAAAAPYQKALDKECAKLGAVEARLAETTRRTSIGQHNNNDAMDIDDE
ncbi:hypothetical protein IWW38_002431, partial [Coemansia aciculifera]